MARLRDANIPTKPGWYYWRRDDRDVWQPADVRYGYSGLVRRDWEGAPHYLSEGNWGGPVPKKEK